MTRDALNNQIVLGNHYGYTTTSSGMSTVILGEAKAASNGKVSLVIVQATITDTIGEDRDEYDGYLGMKRTIRGINLYPVNLAQWTALPSEEEDEE